MKIVVPMAGGGTRFSTRGVSIPKPLIPVAGRPMIDWALQSLKDIAYSQIIFVALREHEKKYGVNDVLQEIIGGPFQLILLDGVTEGQLCTVLSARQYLDTDEDVLIASSDTYIQSCLHRDISQRAPGCRGLISVADMPGDRWSFARTDEDGWVLEVAEKKRISNHASTGLYYFSNGHEMITTADEMIQNQEKTRGEYYVIPVYQKFIRKGWRVRISTADEMWDMGTPEALDHFQAYLVQVNAGQRKDGAV
ncbi:glycosyltransferase family 2 protein [bacterium]|nr:glycosyltransferase family 2 protein [bacterium]